MRDNSLLIICVTVVLCVVLVAGTFVFISFNNNNNGQVASNSAQAGVQLNSSQNSQGSSQGSSSASTGSVSSVSIISATFYSDGNPNTGEVATINLGSENAGKSVRVSTTYFRDGYQFNDGNYATVTVGSDGNVRVTDTTAMSRYPDKCVICVVYDGKTISKTASLGTYKGTQTVSF